MGAAISAMALSTMTMNSSGISPEIKLVFLYCIVTYNRIWYNLHLV